MRAGRFALFSPDHAAEALERVISDEADADVFPLVDLRVGEHSDPMEELRCSYELAKVELFPS